jgi:uncharacterized protein YndB with AHSA1/START domain/uncharacterized protein YdhG (YjbR/CyaY superfamily)
VRDVGSIKIERTFRASLEEVWELWTTKEGLESWWGPEGFTTQVRRLELRPGGHFEYAMTAADPVQVNALKAMGVPLTSVAHGTYSEVRPLRRLAYSTVADFIPGVEPYEVATVVELHPVARGVKLALIQDAMHDRQWTEMAKAGFESQLDKLAGRVAAAKVRSATPARRSTAGRATESVDAYIGAAPEEAQPKLREVRAAIREAAPDAAESISYRMPYYSYKGRLAWFGLRRLYIGLYLRPPIIEEYSDELKMYETTKSAIHLPLEREIPVALIRKLVRARMKKNEAGG